MLMAILIHSQCGMGAPSVRNSLDAASQSVNFGPWIPILPNSNDVPDLDNQWEDEAAASLFAKRS